MSVTPHIRVSSQKRLHKAYLSAKVWSNDTFVTWLICHFVVYIWTSLNTYLAGWGYSCSGYVSVAYVCVSIYERFVAIAKIGHIHRQKYGYVCCVTSAWEIIYSPNLQIITVWTRRVHKLFPEDLLSPPPHPSPSSVAGRAWAVLLRTV